MMKLRTDIRLALPSKGRLEQDSLALLEACGLEVYKPNPRQYQATIPAIPSATVMFQRPGDIVVGVRQGSLDFGIAGTDTLEEKCGDANEIIILHEALGFGVCSLALAVPEEWSDVQSVGELRILAKQMEKESHPLRVATKFPVLTARFLEKSGIPTAPLVFSEGTLEISPSIGYADMISDLVSTGTTLRDNRLRRLEDGTILRSQACLFANRAALHNRPDVLAVAHTLIEYFEAHLRAQEHCLVFANMRGASPREIARKLFEQTDLGGLQGPTISEVIARDPGSKEWYAVNIVVRKADVMQAVQELRSIGGSGVVVSPVTYIFEKEPERYLRLQKELGK
jgi:ATP phosphoribosyltransferase